MGVSDNPLQLARKMQKIANTLPNSQKTGIKQGAEVAKAIIIAEAAAKKVPVGAKIAGRPWGVRITPGGSAATPMSLVSITGQFHLVENRNRQHLIVAKQFKGSRSKRQKAAAKAFSGRTIFGEDSTGALGGFKSSGKGKRAIAFGDVVRAYAFHPGTQGKHIFRDAKPLIYKAVPPVVQRNTVLAIAGVIK